MARSLLTTGSSIENRRASLPSAFSMPIVAESPASTPVAVDVAVLEQDLAVLEQHDLDVPALRARHVVEGPDVAPLDHEPADDRLGAHRAVGPTSSASQNGKMPSLGRNRNGMLLLPIPSNGPAKFMKPPGDTQALVYRLP